MPPYARRCARCSSPRQQRLDESSVSLSHGPRKHLKKILKGTRSQLTGGFLFKDFSNLLEGVFEMVRHSSQVFCGSFGGTDVHDLDPPRCAFRTNQQA